MKKNYGIKKFLKKRIGFTKHSNIFRKILHRSVLLICKMPNEMMQFKNVNEV